MALDELVTEQFVAKAAELGFPTPPLAVRLKLVEATDYWSLFVQPTPPGPAPGLAEWLAPFAPRRLEFGSRHVVRADFDPLPPAWAATFAGTELHLLSIDERGRAVATITGGRAAVAAVTSRARGSAVPVEVRRVGPALGPPRLLTAAQEGALRTAVASGYYLVPRPLNLCQLATRMGVSSAALSERLRRAEGRVITRYVNEGDRSPWDASTLYDARPLLAHASPWPEAEADA